MCPFAVELFAQILAQRCKCAKIERLDRALALLHQFANLDICQLIAKLVEQQLTPLLRQALDRGPQCVLPCPPFCCRLRFIAPLCRKNHPVDRDETAATLIPVPVGDQIVGDAEHPCPKGQSPVLVTVQAIQRSVKNAGGQVLRVLNILDAAEDIRIDAIDIPLIQFAKRIRIFLRLRYQRRFNRPLVLRLRSR